jgi:hypothetical protein
MPAIAPIEDLRAAQEELLEAKALEELRQVFKRWPVFAGKRSVSCGLKKAHRKN